MISKAAQRCVLVAAMVLRPAVVLGQIPFTVTPGNQPAATDPAARLKAYSDLNLKLSGAVEEPASSCLKSYAEYQACVAGKGTAGCASAPTCLVTATLPAMDLSGISFHFVPGVDAATLVPGATNVPAAAPPP